MGKRGVIHAMGRALELVALMAMPSAIWVGHFKRDEAGAIGIFVGSAAVFFAGWLMAKGSSEGA
jgi:hypothetical protein